MSELLNGPTEEMSRQPEELRGQAEALPDSPNAWLVKIYGRFQAAGVAAKTGTRKSALELRRARIALTEALTATGWDAPPEVLKQLDVDREALE